ncbi:FecR family protein [Methylomonas rivi]|uniref:FecR domain-containing protein n=1 Tax=Methylomonas rivi TaxID=2952226 RepID=A0ABT1U7J7_9GAMM|nr:FecR domain-containing protein [Methylomonas sp. WSC-6]MBS4050818.1 FecR domain-containing protein [Methylomonas sp.]MCQ8129839.1 FecR domain-containing protein [Methylomonas sp. WSC-6]
MIKLSMTVLALALSLLPAEVWAESGVLGFVKIVEGDASITAEQGTVPAQPGVPLFLGNLLKTGANGRMGVTFKDNTIMSLGPDTELRIDEYLFAPAKSELKLAASLLKGTLHYISGVIAKLKPEAVSVKTPAGIIGVRGTRFLAKAEAE